MIANLTNALDFQAKALVVRAERQRVIASNIANADTPGYSARDLNFQDAMANAMGSGSSLTLAAQSSSDVNPDGTAHPNHIPLQSTLSSFGQNRLDYTAQSQPAMDGNSVDMDRERANFADNSIRYEAALRFINGNAKTILTAIQGQ